MQGSETYYGGLLNMLHPQWGMDGGGSKCDQVGGRGERVEYYEVA